MDTTEFQICEDELVLQMFIGVQIFKKNQFHKL